MKEWRWSKENKGRKEEKTNKKENKKGKIQSDTNFFLILFLINNIFLIIKGNCMAKFRITKLKNALNFSKVMV